MPSYEHPLPIGVTDLRILHNGRTFYLDVDEYPVTRVSEQGNVPILYLFGGDEFVGEVLEGHWKKYWQDELVGSQPFTAMVNTATSQLYFKGEAAVAGSVGFGNIKSIHPIPFLNETEITVALEVPVDNTGAANRDIDLFFFLTKDYQPYLASNDTDYIYFQIEVQQTGMVYKVVKRKAATYTTLFSGTSCTYSTTRGTGDIEAVIYRMVFHDAVPDAEYPQNRNHMHLYLKYGATIADAEDADECECSTSPFDISDMRYNVGYPSLVIASQNTTYFDDGGEGKVGYVRVDYPEGFEIKYDVSEANRVLNEVKLYDGDPDSGGILVYDVDHEFADDPWIDNGILRIEVGEGGLNRPYLHNYCLQDLSWKRITSALVPSTDIGSTIPYPYLQRVVCISPEKVVLRLKFLDTLGEYDVWVEADLTLKRGANYVIWNNYKLNPPDEFEMYLWAYARQWMYVGDDELAIDDLNVDASNYTMSDNFMVVFDDDTGSTDLFIYFFSAFNKIADEGSQRFFGYRTGTMADSRHGVNDADVYEAVFGCFPWNEFLSSMIEEGEDMTGAADPVVDATAHAGVYERLNANAEYRTHTKVAGPFATNSLQEGRYLWLVRAKDLNQVANDFWLFVRNSTLTKYRNEEGEKKAHTLTADWVWYGIVFDILQSDEDDQDNIALYVQKATAAANEIAVDIGVIIPIGNGVEWAQDIAHGMMRKSKPARRILEKNATL